MSRSIHITSRNFKGLTKKEINEQFIDPTSELSQWSDKSHIKKVTVKNRKQQKNQNEVLGNDISNSIDEVIKKRDMTKEQAIKELSVIPGVGKSLAANLWDIGIQTVADLKGQDPEKLYELSNAFTGAMQDRCVLYVFRCAVYFADTPADERESDKLKWWNWKDKK